METCTDTTLASLSDEQLLALLATEEDRLSRETVDELVQRADRVVGPLTTICRDEEAWADGVHALFWRQVHATLILGTIGGERVLPGLLAALRHASAHEVDWITEDLPALLGNTGEAAIAPLLNFLRDRANGSWARVHAVQGLGALAARLEGERENLLDSLRQIAGQEGEDHEVRTFAADQVLNFVRPSDREFLLAEARRQQRCGGIPCFAREDVEAAYARRTPDFHEYERDWLAFYEPAAIAQRQERWAREREEEPWSRDDSPREEACHAALVRFSATLGDLAAPARGRVRWVAETMIDYAVRHAGVPPWSWPDWRVQMFLEHVIEEVAPPDEEAIRAVPDAILRFACFWEAEGRLSGKQREEVERAIADERDGFVRSALDPAKWSVVKKLYVRMVADGVDLHDQDAVDGWLDALHRASAPRPIRRPERVGRNQPCPCGSGRKYKRCCAGATQSSQRTCPA